MALVPEKLLFNEMGVQRTRSLFKETCIDGDTPFFNLSHHKREGLVNLRELFIQFVEDDPTEVEFAEYVFGDYKYWQKLLNMERLVPYVEEWRMVADVKRKQKAFKAIIQEAKSGKSAFSAAKYLIEEPWIDKRITANKKRSKETTNLASKQMQEDIDRLRDEGFLN